MRKIYPLLLIILLAGCTRVFVREDGTASQRDIQECEYEAMKATGSGGVSFSLTGPSAMGNSALIMEKCLQLRGYHPTYK